MKTTISVPDDIFESADALAKRMEVSRSRLYSKAVEEYLAKHRHRDITANLNAVYSEENSGINPALQEAQRRSISANEW